jgi:hypothetical protein
MHGCKMKKKIPMMNIKRLWPRTKDEPYIDPLPGEEPVRQLFVTFLEITIEKRKSVRNEKRLKYTQYNKLCVNLQN